MAAAASVLNDKTLQISKAFYCHTLAKKKGWLMGWSRMWVTHIFELRKPHNHILHKCTSGAQNFLSPSVSQHGKLI